MLGIEGDPYTDVPMDGEPHNGSALAHRYLTLTGIVWCKGDGKTLSGDKFGSRHLGGCELITREEAQNILFESEKKLEYKTLKSFVKEATN